LKSMYAYARRFQVL
jgi:G3E family GTPase